MYGYYKFHFEFPLLTEATVLGLATFQKVGCNRISYSSASMAKATKTFQLTVYSSEQITNEKFKFIALTVIHHKRF